MNRPSKVTPITALTVYEEVDDDTDGPHVSSFPNIAGADIVLVQHFRGNVVRGSGNVLRQNMALV